MRALYRGEGAAEYDARRSHDTKWRREDELVRAFFGAQLPGRVLDVPVGTGRFVDLYRSHSAQYIGLDLSPDMLARANQNGFPGALALSDAAALPFASDRFDLVLCIRLLNLVPLSVAEAFLQEFARVGTDVVISVRLLHAPSALLKTEGPTATLSALARRFKLNLLARDRKMKPHGNAAFANVLTRTGLRVVRQERIAVGLDGSEYVLQHLKRQIV